MIIKIMVKTNIVPKMFVCVYLNPYPIKKLMNGIIKTPNAIKAISLKYSLS